MSRVRLLPFLLIALLIAGCAQQTPLGPSAPSSPNAQQPAPLSQNTSPAAQPSPPQPAISIPSKDFSFYSAGWQVYGTEYPSQDNSPSVAVILVPGLGQDRSSYPADFIERVHSNLPNALVVAIDPRGSGQSTNVGTYQSFSTANFRDMRNDITDLISKQLVDNHPSLGQFYVVGAGMGSTSAILATAQERRIVKVAMLSPGISYQGVDISGAIPGYSHQLFIAYTDGDSYSSQSAGRISSIASELQLTTKTYSGSVNGTDMFGATAGSSPSLSDDLISFLKDS